MKTTTLVSSVCFAVLCFAVSILGRAERATRVKDISARTRILLNAYAKGDREAVLDLVDRDTVTMYGSDVAEVFHRAEGVEKMLKEDLRLWGGSALIGPMEHVTVVEGKDVASIFFDAPFTAGGRPPIQVRFAMVWKLTGRKWLLVQSANAVPTHGQSAEELLKGAS